jgi:endonuclease YncB( thermonuclease family)
MSLILACAMLLAVDGDTIKCDGVNMRDMGPGAPFVSGYDTPEIGHAKCPAERAAGKRAKARLQQLLDQPGVQVVDSGKRDRYGRPLVWVKLANGRTAGEVLIGEGFAVRWTPDYEPGWCG